MLQLYLQIRKNLSDFLQDKKRIAVTFFSIAAIMCVYFVGLKGFVLQTVERQGVYGRDKLFFADRLMVSGLLIVVSAVTCFGSVTAAVRKIEQERQGTKRSSDTDPMVGILGDWITATLLSFFFTLFTFLAYEAYFLNRYGSMLSVPSLLKGMGLLFLSSVVNSGFLLIIGIVIKSSVEYRSFTWFYGGIFGFIAPVYLPYFFYGGVIKKALFPLPCTQLTSLLRQVCLSGELERLHKELTERKLLKIQTAFGLLLTEHGNRVAGERQLSMVIIFIAALLLFLWVISERRTVSKPH